jgi:hypothetical protein
VGLLISGKAVSFRLEEQEEVASAMRTADLPMAIETCDESAGQLAYISEVVEQTKKVRSNIAFFASGESDHLLLFVMNS